MSIIDTIKDAASSVIESTTDGIVDKLADMLDFEGMDVSKLMEYAKTAGIYEKLPEAIKSAATDGSITEAEIVTAIKEILNKEYISDVVEKIEDVVDNTPTETV